MVGGQNRLENAKNAEMVTEKHHGKQASEKGKKAEILFV